MPTRTNPTSRRSMRTSSAPRSSRTPPAPGSSRTSPTSRRPGASTSRSAPSASTASSPRLPGTFREFIARHPQLGAAHERIAKAVERAGPLPPRTLSLVKIGICLGAGLESALRSHVRRARRHGASKQEVEQAILLGMNTVGFPRTVAAWSWALEQFRRDG